MAGKTDKCGVCKKVVAASANGVMCEVCEVWFHSKCQNISDDTYRLLNQDKIHFFCGNCDKAVGKILKSLTELSLRQEKLEQKVETMTKDFSFEFSKVYEELGDVKRRVEKNNWQEDMSKMRTEITGELKKVTEELGEIKDCMPSEDRRVMNDEEDFKKLEKEVNDMKSVMDSQVKKTVMVVKEDVEEALEIERRKMNLVIHGLPDIDAEQDIDQVAAILCNGLHMDYDRNVSSMMRIWKLDVNKPRPLRIVIKSLDGKKEILSRAKDLKNVDTFKRMFISPDLTRRQQKVDKELRTELKKFREQGEGSAKIKYGKIVKNINGKEVVLYQIVQHQ